MHTHRCHPRLRPDFGGSSGRNCVAAACGHFFAKSRRSPIATTNSEVDGGWRPRDALPSVWCQSATAEPPRLRDRHAADFKQAAGWRVLWSPRFEACAPTLSHHGGGAFVLLLVMLVVATAGIMSRGNWGWRLPTGSPATVLPHAVCFSLGPCFTW